MGSGALGENLRIANMIADVQHAAGPHERAHIAAPIPDPGLDNANRISPQDLLVLKERFPMLCQFSDDFLQSRSMDELLRIESTSLRVKDAERTRENEDKLSQNKLGLDTKYYEVQAGRDNRWTELHPARFLPGAACTAKRQYTRAREVLGLSSPPPHWLL
jgi:hypothetical protein